MAPWSEPCADLGDRRGSRRSVTPVSGKGAGCRAPWFYAGALLSGLPASARAAAACWLSMLWWPYALRRLACRSIHRLWASHADCLVVPRPAPICVHEAPAARADRTVAWRPEAALQARTPLDA